MRKLNNIKPSSMTFMSEIWWGHYIKYDFNKKMRFEQFVLLCIQSMEHRKRMLGALNEVNAQIDKELSRRLPVGGYSGSKYIYSPELATKDTRTVKIEPFT